MRNGKLVFLVATLLGVTAVVSYLGGRFMEGRAGSRATASDDDGRSRQPGAVAGVVAVPTPPGRAETTGDLNTNMTPELAAQRLRERAADLDQNFLEDPVAPGWADRMQATIEEVIVQPGLIDAAEYGLVGHDVECRSRSCRVSMRFENDGLSEQATDLVRLELAPVFDQALTVPLRNPDGSVEYRVYMVTAEAASLLRKRRQDRPASVEGAAVR